MKELSEVPLEFKLEDKTKLEGKYFILHPWIKDYYLEVNVKNEENLSLRIIKLMQRSKGIFKNVARYPTYEEVNMIRDAFWHKNETVAQIIEIIDYKEFYIHLFKLNTL